MGKQCHEDALIVLKAKIHAWGFDNNDLSTIAKQQSVILLVMDVILHYLSVWPESGIIDRWCD